jgi:hypothetical protein
MGSISKPTALGASTCSTSSAGFPACSLLRGCSGQPRSQRLSMPLFDDRLMLSIIETLGRRLYWKGQK